jgi:hypothetical protein
VRWFDSPEGLNCKKQRKHELIALSRRMRWGNWAINLLCGSALVVCVNIFLLVLQGYFDTLITDWILGSFVFSLALLMLGLICFFVEVSIATTSLRVSEPLIRDD